MLREQGVETVVTTGGERSNHARITAFFCAALGIRCVLVLDRKPRPFGAVGHEPASVFLDELVGAEVHLTDSIAAREATAKGVASEMRLSGKRVSELPLGGALAEGALGFVDAMNELAEQQKELEINFDHLYFSSSTAGTHAGMLVGSRLFGIEGLKIVGIAPEQAGEEIRHEVSRLVKETCELLGIEETPGENEIFLRDEFAGEGYCMETNNSAKAMELVGKMEGIVLDPVYTAKAMAGLLDDIRLGRLTNANNILFWHTGGQMTLFYALK